MTVEIPADALETADADAFTWQMPGLRHELVTALIRSLPKAKRRYFVPAPDVASEVLAGLTPYEGRLPEVLAASLTARTGGGELTDLVPIAVTADDFDRTRIPPHLVMEFAVMRGDTAVTRDRDLFHQAISESDLLECLRMEQVERIEDTHLAVLEAGGKISVLPRSKD